jgi:hypothetical protein
MSKTIVEYFLNPKLPDASLIASNESIANSSVPFSDFVNDKLWTALSHVAHCHDSVSCHKWPQSHPLSLDRVKFEFLGQKYDEHHELVDVEDSRTRNANAALTDKSCAVSLVKTTLATTTVMATATADSTSTAKS